MGGVQPHADGVAAPGAPGHICGRDLAFALQNDVQRGFPLVQRPYAALAAVLGTSEAAVLATLRQLIESGRVSRVGAVFAPRRIGTSTLAAMAVPPERLDSVAACVGARREVNHSYERENALNLWFVATAPDDAALSTALSSIERDTGIAVLRLPLLTEYHIDLGFDLTGRRERPRGGAIRHGEHAPQALDPAERALVAALGGGLRLVPEPFAAIAAQAGWADGGSVVDRLVAWSRAGVIRRFGVVLHHRALGYVANAMCVWDVPDADVDVLGEALARERAVTLCYRRGRVDGAWPYNLYCMIHGRSRGEVNDALRAISARRGLAAYAGAVLFSRRAFKQRGADYGTAVPGMAGTSEARGVPAHG